MNSVYSWIKSIIFFLLIVSIVNNLIGDSSYKKYINLVTGMILIILVVSPLTNLFHINEKIDYYFAKNTFEVDTEDISNKLIKIENEQKVGIIEEYKKEIERQTKELLEKEGLYISYFKVIISEKVDEFGVIEGIDLVASYTVYEEDNISEPEDNISEPIEKIEIDKVEIEKNKDNEDDSYIRTKKTDEGLSSKETYIMELLSDFYNLDKKNISIDIRES